MLRCNISDHIFVDWLIAEDPGDHFARIIICGQISTPGHAARRGPAARPRALCGGEHRFVVLARAPRDPATLAGIPALTTLVFEVKNVPAALYKALGGFATNGVNMTKLESYQKGASFAATMFFCDVLGAPGQPAIDQAIEELAFHCKDLRILGCYPQARARG